jgi:hypothetical protein
MRRARIDRFMAFLEICSPAHRSPRRGRRVEKLKLDDVSVGSIASVCLVRFTSGLPPAGSTGRRNTTGLSDAMCQRQTSPYRCARNMFTELTSPLTMRGKITSTTAAVLHSNRCGGSKSHLAIDARMHADRDSGRRPIISQPAFRSFRAARP